MGKQVAVITDAMSPDHFFPYWHKYYGENFGYRNLVVLTCTAMREAFSHYDLGRVLEIGPRYSDAVRAHMISEAVSALLQNYGAVVRADVDEFLLPDPARHESLAAYVEQLSLPYVTAMGIDVIRCPEEAPLVMDGSGLLAQRRFCVRNTALNKIAIVRSPVRWSAGFHYANVRSRLDDVFLLHMKLADLEARAEWFDRMLTLCEPGSPEAVYYSDARSKLENASLFYTSLPRAEGAGAFSDMAFESLFMRSADAAPVGGVYRFDFAIDRVALPIPPDFARFV